MQMESSGVGWEKSGVLWAETYNFFGQMVVCFAVLGGMIGRRICSL